MSKLVVKLDTGRNSQNMKLIAIVKKSKGLGKHENGISEALKPKLKRSVTGVGHDPASEFNEHWWTTLYDKAAGNVEVKEKNGKTKKIKTKGDNEFVIANCTWKLNKKKKSQDEEQYSEHFVRTAVLTSGGSKTEKVKDSESDEDDADQKRDVFKMTDEELFAACEGRTAHKGARHGLKALGKLARIAQQEAMLLSQPKYEGYSHSTAAKEVDIKSNIESEDIIHKKKKKRKVHSNDDNLEIHTSSSVNEVTGCRDINEISDDKMISRYIGDSKLSAKVKMSKKKAKEPTEVLESKKKKSKRAKQDVD